MLERMAYRGWMGWVGVRVLRAAAGAALRVAIAGGVGAVLSGCVFGVEEEKEGAMRGIDQWVYDNSCVPEECLYECCQGWNYSPIPTLVGATSKMCSEYRTNFAEYAQYDFLMSQDYNFCNHEFQYIEGGTCTIVRPADVLKKSGPDGKLEYAGLSFITCPPRGQPANGPMEGVTLIPLD